MPLDQRPCLVTKSLAASFSFNSARNPAVAPRLTCSRSFTHKDAAAAVPVACLQRKPTPFPDDDDVLVALQTIQSDKKRHHSSCQFTSTPEAGDFRIPSCHACSRPEAADLLWAADSSTSGPLTLPEAGGSFSLRDVSILTQRSGSAPGPLDDDDHILACQATQSLQTQQQPQQEKPQQQQQQQQQPDLNHQDVPVKGKVLKDSVVSVAARAAAPASAAPHGCGAAGRASKTRRGSKGKGNRDEEAVYAAAAAAFRPHVTPRQESQACQQARGVASSSLAKGKGDVAVTNPRKTRIVDAICSALMACVVPCEEASWHCPYAMGMCVPAPVVHPAFLRRG